MTDLSTVCAHAGLRKDYSSNVSCVKLQGWAVLRVCPNVWCIHVPVHQDEVCTTACAYTCTLYMYVCTQAVIYNE